MHNCRNINVIDIGKLQEVGNNFFVEIGKNFLWGVANAKRNTQQEKEKNKLKEESMVITKSKYVEYILCNRRFVLNEKHPEKSEVSEFQKLIALEGIGSPIGISIGIITGPSFFLLNMRYRPFVT